MKAIDTLAGAVLAIGCATSALGAEALQVTLDKYQLVRLDAELATVLIANPNIADVGIESTRLVVLVGRTPGETNLVILDKEGNEILNTPVVVVPNLDRQVTLHRGIAEATFSCDPRCALVPNPGAGPALPIGGGTPPTEEEERAGAARTSADIAAAAAAAAAAAVAAQPEQEGE